LILGRHWRGGRCPRSPSRDEMLKRAAAIRRAGVYGTNSEESANRAGGTPLA
jgi:hypothetical protein